jgi:N-acyl-D-aspartate/D-glutamate deacylase
VTAAALSLIVTNARIRTGDAARPWATALGVQDGRLAVVGSAAEILKLAGAGTTVIDARGQHLALPVDVAVGSHITVCAPPGGGQLTIDSSQDG